MPDAIPNSIRPYKYESQPCNIFKVLDYFVALLSALLYGIMKYEIKPRNNHAVQEVEWL